MKPSLEIALLACAFLPFPGQGALYRPALLEDTPLYPDPIVRTSNSELPCELVRRHADGTVDVIVTGGDWRKHLRLRQPVIVGPTWDGPESGVILRNERTLPIASEQRKE